MKVNLNVTPRVDTLVLPVASNNVVVSLGYSSTNYSYDDLNLWAAGKNGAITVQDFFYAQGGNNTVESFRFSDGVTWSAADRVWIDVPIIDDQIAHRNLGRHQHHTDLRLRDHQQNQLHCQFRYPCTSRSVGVESQPSKVDQLRAVVRPGLHALEPSAANDAWHVQAAPQGMYA